MTRSALKRIAFCTPVNPVASGISDYSEELLPELGRYFDITVIVDDGVQPANNELIRCLPVEAASKLPKLHRRRSFDAIIYHLGNSPYHATFYDFLHKLPGVVVLHDFVLHHMVVWWAVNRLKRVSAYTDELARRYGPASLDVARLILAGRYPESAFDYPCCESVIELADGLIAHSRYVAERVDRIRPGMPVAVVPMGVPLPPPIARAEARARLGLPQETLIWASFGHINPYKRLEPALRAFRRLRSDHPDALYILVGSSLPTYDIKAVVRRLGLQDAVRITGHVPTEMFQDYVAAADLCLNLRHPTAGETSASLLRLLGAGKPVLVSATGAFAELPPDVAAQVDTDECEESLILAYGQRLAQDPALAAELGRRAREYVASRHTIAGAARGYAAFLAQLYGWQEPQPVRPPLWELAAWAPQAQPSTAGAAATQPAAPAAPASLVSLLVGAAAADLGLQEHDVDMLDRVAARLRGL